MSSISNVNVGGASAKRLKTEPMESPSWLLPKDLFRLILSSPQLQIEDLYSCRLVCKYWNQLAEDNLLWRCIWERDFVTSFPKEKIDNAQEEYKRTFRICKNTRKGDYTCTVFQDQGFTRSCVFSNVKSQIITAGFLNPADATCNIKVWNSTTKECEDVFENFTKIDFILALHTKNQVLINLKRDRAIVQLDLETRQQTEVFKSIRAPNSIILSRDDTFLVVIFNKPFPAPEPRYPIKIVNLTDSKCKTLEGHAEYIADFMLNSDQSQIVSAGEDGIIKFWEVSTGKLLREIDQGARVSTFALAENRLFSATGSGKITIWDLQSGKNITFIENSNLILSMSLSRSYKQLFSDSESEITIWNLGSDESTRIKKDSKTCAITLLLSDDEKCLISTNLDSTIRFWNLVNSTCSLAIKDCHFMGWSNNKLLTLDLDQKQFRLFDFDTQDVVPQEYTQTT